MSTLIEQQQLIASLVEKGHNVYFGGIAGSGKTFLAKHVVTGIACTLYGCIPAQTIHSSVVIGQCHGTKEHLLSNVLSNEYCVGRSRSTEALCIDEISMLSKR